MIRQFRIDRFNGIEFLVCEVYFKHTWTQSENDAYSRFLSSREGPIVPRLDFAVLVQKWCDEHTFDQDNFFGLTEPIPAIDQIPHIVVRGAIVNNRVASLNVDYFDSVTTLEVMDNIKRFYDFVKSPHWRNTVLSQISNYGSLFGSDND